MDHDHHSPIVVHHTLTNGRTYFAMNPEENEAHLLTTAYPTKDFVAHIVTQPCGDDDEDRAHSQRCKIVSMPLDNDSATAVANNRVQIMLTTYEYLADLLKTRVLFWNCTAGCLCNYRGEISSLRVTDEFDVAVILGGGEEDETTVTFWSNMGLTGSALSNFGGHGPSVTIKWDEAVVGVVTAESLVSNPAQPRVLTVRAERLLYAQTINRTFTSGEIDNGDLSPPADGSSSEGDM